MQIPYISKQFALKHYLGLTEEEFNENQRLLEQEMANVLKNKKVQVPVVNNNAAPGLRTVDISDITQEYIDATADNLNAGMSGGDMLGGGLGGGDLGGGLGDLGGTPTSGDLGDLGGTPTSGETGGLGGGTPTSGEAV